MYQYGFYSPFHIVFGFLSWIVFFVAILWLIQAMRGNNHLMDKVGKHGFGRDGAMELLRERYAKGEINKEEFESKKKDLMA